MKLSIETCAIALNSAALNRKAALQLELAVGLGIFLSCGGAGREAKQLLTEAYAAAGYNCIQVHGMDYKTVNRRVNATAALYERLPVAKWAGKHNEDVLLRSIHMGLSPYEFYTLSDVFRFCTPVVAQAAQRTEVKPHAAILTPVSHTGQDKVIAQFRRAADQVAKGARHIETPNLALMIPEGVEPEEMIELAMKLLELAKAKDLLTA